EASVVETGRETRDRGQHAQGGWDLFRRLILAPDLSPRRPALDSLVEFAGGLAELGRVVRDGSPGQRAEALTVKDQREFLWRCNREHCGLRLNAGDSIM